MLPSLSESNNSYDCLLCANQQIHLSVYLMSLLFMFIAAVLKGFPQLFSDHISIHFGLTSLFQEALKHQGMFAAIWVQVLAKLLLKMALEAAPQLLLLKRAVKPSPPLPLLQRIVEPALQLQLLKMELAVAVGLEEGALALGEWLQQQAHLSRSWACITARWAQPPAPSNWTSQMNGKQAPDTFQKWQWKHIPHTFVYKEGN